MLDCEMKIMQDILKLLNFIFVIYKCLLFMCFDCLCVLMSIVSRFNSIYLGSRRPFISDPANAYVHVSEAHTTHIWIDICVCI